MKDLLEEKKWSIIAIFSYYGPFRVSLGDALRHEEKKGVGGKGGGSLH